MNDPVITDVRQVTPEWLTSILVRSGALTHGAVASIVPAAQQGNWSSSASLLIQYSEDAQGRLPDRLFLKMVETDLGDGEWFGDSEVTYYTRDYVDVKDAPLLRCYSAGYSQEAGRYHLLLDDVSLTHLEADEKPFTLESGMALAEALAILHARWWGAQRLAEAGAAMHSPEHIRQFVDIAAPGVEHILSRYSHELKPHWQALMRTIFARHPQVMVKRSLDPQGFTIIHGDVGAGNVLVPRQGDRPIYVIDRQPFNWSLTVWLGVYDLAYAIVLDWDSELRRQHELAVLQRYHAHLLKNGVADYPWERLLYDYKLCAVMGVFIATEYCRGGVNEAWVHAWLPMLQRALTACYDLQCSSLWEGL